MMYMKSILARLLKNLNNMKSCTLLDAPTLNYGHEIERILVLHVLAKYSLN
jgi:hypothetical protein